MMLKLIIFALVFAFLARGAGGEDVNNKGTLATNSSKNRTLTTNSSKNNTLTTNNGKDSTLITNSSKNNTLTTNNGKNNTLTTNNGKNNTLTTNKGNDSKENMAKKCKLYAKKCQKWSLISSKEKPAALEHSPSRNGRTAKPTTNGTEEPFPVAQPTKLMMTANCTRQWDRPVQPDTSGTMHSNNDHICNCNHSCHHYNHGNLALWVALAIVTVLLVGHVVYHWQPLIRRPPWNQVPNNDADVANSDVGFRSLTMRPASTNISQEQLNEGITLEQLEHENLVEFEWMCMRLDNGQRRDYERLAAKYPRISLDQRQSLHNEFQNRGGSPSKALMKHLQVLYPYLTLGDLLRSLAEIGRVDIVQRLKQRVKKNTCSTVV